MSDKVTVYEPEVLSKDEKIDPEPKYDNPIAQRRAIEEELAGYGWGPKKIGEHLFRLHRHLIPSDTLTQAVDLVRKDLKVIFDDVVDAEDALSRGRMAEHLLRRRLMEQYEEACVNAKDLNCSEQYRVANQKLKLELTMQLAKLDRIDIDGALKKPKEGGRFKVLVGEGGVGRTVNENDEQETSN